MDTEASSDACALADVMSARAAMEAEAAALVVADASAVVDTELIVVNCKVRVSVVAASSVDVVVEIAANKPGGANVSVNELTMLTHAEEKKKDMKKTNHAR